MHSTGCVSDARQIRLVPRQALVLLALRFSIELSRSYVCICLVVFPYAAFAWVRAPFSFLVLCIRECCVFTLTNPADCAEIPYVHTKKKMGSPVGIVAARRSRELSAADVLDRDI